MTQQTPYIGSKISLISKLDIRYEGILYTVDSKESTIALSKVKSYGTEDRNAAHTVPPQDDVYDYIIFKANDIKDLIVCETPKPPAPAFTDPAILQQGAIVSKEKPAAPGPIGGEIASATRSSTPRDNAHSPSQQQTQQPKTWKNNDNKSNNSTYRQGGYQNRNNQNRQQGYDGGNNKQQPRTYESQNRNGSNNYRQGQQNRNYESQNRNNYNNQNNRGGPRNQSHGNRPLGPNNKLKFENDYDFEKAYEQFKETLEAIVGDVQNVKLDDSHDDDAGSVKSGDGNETFYDKNKSFFDTISCEALEKEEGMNTRPDWRKERLTNQETFGQQAIRYFGYRRGGYNNRGGGGYNNRGGYGNNRQQGYDNNRQNGYDNNRRGGYGGYNRGYDNNRQQQGRDNNRQQGESKRN